jgi:hypothetical protein
MMNFEFDTRFIVYEFYKIKSVHLLRQHASAHGCSRNLRRFTTALPEIGIHEGL